MMGGSMCATVPGACSACDHLFEQALPVEAWGTRYHTVPVNGVNGSTYRIMAHQNGTQVSVGGAAPVTINAGQRIEVNTASTPVCIDASLPVSVAQILEGYACVGNGDPALILLSPADRVSKTAYYTTPTSAQLNSHSVSIVVPSAATNQVSIDGTAVNSALFQPYAGCTDKKFAKVPVSQGTHRVHCDAGFQAYAFGIGFGESYAANVGNIGTIPVQEDSTVCGAGTVTLNSPEVLVNTQWTAESAPNTVIGMGNSITITPTHSESYTINGQLPVSGCARSFTYHVGIPLTIPTMLSANNQTTVNVCQYEPVQLGLIPPPDTAWFDINWWPATSLINATSNAPVATPLQTTWYDVNIQSPTGCGSLIDSILV
ncbi:MAG TPA: IgGFc-binding protein, partial [Flavobacteriales bacterium]|nr:IgGFc-binding protein [Flavobacteriales bacterium]